MNEFPGYATSHEDAMRVYSRSLPEDHRRRYAAVEALKIGFGGVAYIARVLGMSRRTIYTGIRELQGMVGDDRPSRPSGDSQRIRRPGGGRPRRADVEPALAETVETVLEARTAGSPTDPSAYWTDLTPGQLATELLHRGFRICRNTVSNLLREAGFRRRALRKELITGQVDPDERDRQFRHIAELRQTAEARGNPVLCIDTKKKEHLGRLHRPGTCYRTGPQPVFDHDFPHLAQGTLVPHGVYDPRLNLAAITLGTSRETSPFVCDSIAWAWETVFRDRYPQATEVLLLCDSGGANPARGWLFKEELVALSQRLGLPIRLAHYPPYTSKWNPIEHRLFSQVERVWRGVLLDSPPTALHTLAHLETATGLRVIPRLLDQVYAIGQTCSAAFRKLKERFIRHDEILGKWNYLVNGNGLPA